MEAETPADRIRSRATRLDAKKASTTAKKDAAIKFGSDALAAAAPKSSGKAMARVADGMSALDAKKARTIEAVTSVRMDADMREQERRAAEDEKIQDRLHRLREEAASSGRANAAVQLKWADILERNLPQELAAEIATQRDACGSILGSKEALLADLQAEMRAKDEEYVRSLQQQRDDIERLISQMSAQFFELSRAYEGEMDAMEGAFMQERDELLTSNKKEIDALFEARRSMENRFVEEKLGREEAYARELADMQAADAENYQKLKVKLETDVQILEQQLENMKFTYLLNTEKLEYNYRVLTERDSENKQTLAGQKQRLARLRAALAKVQAEYETSEARFKSKNASLTEEYTRITRQYRDLQAKFRHFEASDATRYSEIVAMHRDEMSAIADRLLAADRVITEQLLGWTWSPPVSTATAGTGGVSLSARSGGGGEGALIVPPMTDMHLAAKLLEETSHTTGATGRGRGRSRSGGRSLGTEEGDATSSVGGEGEGGGGVAVDADHVRNLLRLLVRTCGAFLLDNSVQSTASRLEAQGKRHIADVLRAHSLLAVLGTSALPDVASLTSDFQHALLASAVDSGLPPAEYGLDVVDPATDLVRLPFTFSVIRYLKEWLEARKRAAKEAGGGDGGATAATEALGRLKAAATTSPSATGRGGDGGGGGAGGGAALGGGESSVFGSGVAGDLAYWEAVSNTIPPEKARVWKALERGLTNYKTILLARSRMVDECESLEAENAALRTSLSQYLSPQYNSMQVPPSHTVHVGPAAAAALMATLAGAPGGGGGGEASAQMHASSMARPAGGGGGLYRPTPPAVLASRAEPRAPSSSVLGRAHTANSWRTSGTVGGAHSPSHQPAYLSAEPSMLSELSLVSTPAPRILPSRN